jgi:hypothetical protein
MADLNPIHFAAGNVDITLSPPSSPQSIGQALLENKRFPDDAFVDGVIPLGSIKAAASKDFKLDKVKFKASGSLFAGFGVYRSTSKLLDALKADGLDEPMVGRLEFPDEDKRNIFALRWGYDAEGSISGTVALGPSISFGASGRTEALYAVLRSLDRNQKALDSITETIDSWKMPRQVSVPDNLPPGTWLIAETDGELKLSLGLEYGYNYSWVREALTLGGLAGDFGVKIELGVKAQLGFNASGRYATVMSRESESKMLRLQIFKMRQRGWTFAFDAGLSAQVEQDIIPKNFDDFIKGVFNVNGHQAIHDILKEFDKWTDPKKKLRDLLGAELVDYAKGLVKEVTGIDPDTDIDNAIKKLRAPLELWRALPHEVTSVLYEWLRQNTPLDDLRKFLKQVAEATGAGANEKLVSIITEELRQLTFFETPIGQWLTAISEQGILSLLANISQERERLNELAKQTLALLDGSKVEDTLRKLQAWIEEKLGLDKVLAIVDEASFANIDKWLKKRLSEFLGETVVFTELEKIQTAINALRSKGEKFYEKGYEALMEKYQAEFHYSFQKTTTRTALLDVTFDYTTAANAKSAEKYLKQALSGDFNEILSKELAGVKLNKGVLTHEIKRRTHIEVGLPYFNSAIDHINESLAEGEAVDSADGRLWVFNLKAFDVVSKKNSLSKLSVTMQLSKKVAIRRFSGDESKYDYSLRLIKRNARREYMEEKLNVLVDKYLASEFSGEGKKPFPDYLTALDKTLDEKGIAGDNEFGNVLTAFDVSLPAQVLAAWKKAPLEEKHRTYMQMSMRIQNVLRQMIPLCFFQESERYRETVSAYPLLVYSALPPLNRLKLSGGKLKFSEDAVYKWDFRDADLRKLLFEQHCRQKLRDVILPRVRKELGSKPDIKALYEDFKIDEMFRLQPANTTRRYFEGLIINEDDLITKAQHAGQHFREFLQADELDKALEELTKFGADLTAAFNNTIGDTVYAGETLRPLGSLLFVEVAKIFDLNLTDKIVPTAMLELYILQKQSTFVMEEFLTGERPKKEDIALQQRIINVGAPTL